MPSWDWLVTPKDRRRARGLCAEPMRGRDVGESRSPGYGAAPAGGAAAAASGRSVPDGCGRSGAEGARGRRAGEAPALVPASALPQRQPRSVCTWAAAGPGPAFQPRVGRARTGGWEEVARHRLGRGQGRGERECLPSPGSWELNRAACLRL